MVTKVHRKLFWKLFLSYILVFFLGLVVLGLTIRFSIPSAFNRHTEEMNIIITNHGMRWGMMGLGNMTRQMFSVFNTSIREAMSLSFLLAFLAALITSGLISRQMVLPVAQMTDAAQRIADGHYSERVKLPPNKQEEELDELELLALRFNQMAENLEHIETIRRQLIGDVSHELRTPLTTIKGSMEGLIDGVLPANPETFEQLYQEATRLEHMVDDLQELSRVEGGIFSLNLQPLSVTAFAETLRIRITKQFKEKNIEFSIDVPDKLTPVMADEERIGQVLLNLAVNALQFTPAGGKVRLSAIEKNNEVQISIADNGCGISAEHLPFLFNRFYRVDKSRSRSGGGSGIGLTIAKHIVEAHGGTTWASSEGEGKGSIFTLTLPISQQKHNHL